MPVRFYLPSSGTSPLPSLAVHTAWSGSVANFSRGPLERTKTNTALASQAASFLSTASRSDCWRQWTSEPLTEPYSFLATHTASCVMRCVESAANVDGHLALTVRVVSGDGATVRGVLLSHHTSSTEFATSASTRILSALALSAVSALAGDRIVIELGGYGVTPSTSGTATLRYGDPSATADFALTANLTTDLVPWVELSASPNFDTVSESGSASFSVTASGASNIGWAEDGSAALAITASGAGQLTSAASASATVALAATGSAEVTLAAAGAATASFTATATTDMTGFVSAVGAADLALAATGAADVSLAEAGSAQFAAAAAGTAQETLAADGAVVVALTSTGAAGATLTASGSASASFAATGAVGVTRIAAGAVAFAVAASGAWSLEVGAEGHARFFVTASNAGEVAYEGGIPPQYLQSYIFAPGVLNYGR